MATLDEMLVTRSLRRVFREKKSKKNPRRLLISLGTPGITTIPPGKEMFLLSAIRANTSWDREKNGCGTCLKFPNIKKC